jgi:hypothetical protein
MIKLSHAGHLVTLAMMIAGIVVGRNAQLSSVNLDPLRLEAPFVL